MFFPRREMVRMKGRLSVAVSALLLLFACAEPPSVPTAPVHATTLAPLYSRPVGDAIAGQYIVVFNDDVGDPHGLADELARAHGASVRFT